MDNLINSILDASNFKQVIMRNVCYRNFNENEFISWAYTGAATPMILFRGRESRLQSPQTETLMMSSDDV